MKKLLVALLALTLVGCSTAKTATPTPSAGADSVIKMENLDLQFVPSKDADVIITGTQNLPELLKAALLEEGYDVTNVNITVGVSYDATGEAMDAGSIDLGWVPGGTYALYSEGIEAILTATRAGLSNDSTDPATWNGLANKTEATATEVTYYRSLILATPSEYGKELAAKVNAGEKLTWEDLDKASWAVQKTSSSAGYIYPSLWLNENYGKKITDLSNVVALDSGYGTAFSQAAAEQVDIIVCYADARMDYAEAWNIATTSADSTGKVGFGRIDSVFDEMNVIGVTEGIYNDAVAITKNNPEVYTPEFIKAVQNAMIKVIGTPEGKEIFSVYSHTGYAMATDADYDTARAALEAVK